MPGSATERTVTLPHPALSGADWADAWTATPCRRFDTARQAAEAVHRATPGWVGPLMGLRTLAVAPFGLKSGLSNRGLAPADRIGLFAVRDDSGDRVVVGMDDRHLDFRCVLDLDEADGQQTVTVTTLIRRHNRLGRAYLATILPFHRLILQACLSRL